MHLSFDFFVNPPANARRFKKKDGRFYNSLATDLPLGPLSMSSYIKQYLDIEVKLIDFNVELNSSDSFSYNSFYDYCLEFLSKIDFKPDLVGVSSLFSPSFHNFMDCGKASKVCFPGALVVGGGSIPTNSYKYIFEDLNNTDFDAFCFGEGEKPLLELLLAVDKEEYLSKSSSWITKSRLAREGASFETKHNYVENLDEIPFYDYDLCDFSRHGLNPVMSAYASIKNQNGFHIMTSRGCPYKCTFCASHKVHGRSMRYHSVERVRQDFTKLKNEYGASTIIFQDDHFMADKNRVLKILDIIGDLELEAIFQNGLTLYALDRPMLEAFYRVGVRQLVLPVESGSEKVLLKQMKKPLKLAYSQRVATDCRDLGIYTNTNILIGMPGETKEDIEEARVNLRTRVPTNWFHIVCASPIVGSEMHQIALENNYIQGDTLGADYRKAVINTPDFTAEYIQDMQYLMNLELNFVYNNDIRFKQYDIALKGLLNAIRVKDDHAFGYFFAALCFHALGNSESSESYLEKYLVHSKDSFWKKYIDYFSLPTTKSECIAFFEKQIQGSKPELRHSSPFEQVQANRSA